ncbi:MAG: exo-alpha-sialidase [Acutalibacteraceae bacterium]
MFRRIISFLASVIMLIGVSPCAAKEIIVSSERELIFTEKPTESCHASTVLPLDNGTVVAAWFAGTKEKADDVVILTSVRTENGWSEPVKVSAEENTAHWNPVLFELSDGTVALYFKVGKEIASWKTYVCYSSDAIAWSEPEELVPGDTSGGRGPVKNKPLRLNSGAILAPASDESGKTWRAFVDISNDDGKTWERTDFIEAKLGVIDIPMIQPTLWQSKDGSVHMFTRTKAGKIYRSDSFDEGKTWSEAYPTAIGNNNSGIDLDTDSDGRIFLVCNPHSAQGIRTPLSLLVSTDDGKSFKRIMNLEAGLGEYSYPAIVIRGDTIHITYTYERDYIVYRQIKIK